MPEPGVNGVFYPEGVRDWDPVNHAAMAEASGRVGTVAWALFRGGDNRLILAIEAINGNRTVIHADTAGERRGFKKLVGALELALDTYQGAEP